MLSKNAETIYSIFHPEDRDFLFAKIYMAIADKKKELIYEYRAKHKNGQYVWLEELTKCNYDKQAYVEMLGGKIWLESVEGKGSTFYFTLPYLTS